MRRLLSILILMLLSVSTFAQGETRVIDSLQNAMKNQEGRDKVLTMIELIWEFYDFSYDDCISWGERAIKEAQSLGDVGLEAKANYVLGVQYGYHSDLDLAQTYLKRAFSLYTQMGDEANAFEALWNQAYFELLLGNMDTAYVAFQKVMAMAENRHDEEACAQASANMAVIHYQKGQFESAIETFKSSRAFSASLNDSAAVAHVDLNLATAYRECGMCAEARELYISVISRIEAIDDPYYLQVAYKNYGLMFERDFVNYDSANYYFNKALAISELEIQSPDDRQTIDNAKSDVLTEMGNVAYLQNDYQQALRYFEEALSIAENNNYHFGQMYAMLGLGELYARQGMASKSMHYLDRYAEEASRSGITMMEPVVKKTLISNYARLGRFAEMDKEIDELDEHRASLARQNVDVVEQNTKLLEANADLLADREDKVNQITALRNQRNHYRLAFFGLLCLCMAAIVLFLVFKIVRKNKPKKGNT